MIFHSTWKFFFISKLLLRFASSSLNQWSEILCAKWSLSIFVMLRNTHFFRCELHKILPSLHGIHFIIKTSFKQPKQYSTTATTTSTANKQASTTTAWSVWQIVVFLIFQIRFKISCWNKLLWGEMHRRCSTYEENFCNFRSNNVPKINWKCWSDVGVWL